MSPQGTILITKGYNRALDPVTAHQNMLYSHSTACKCGNPICNQSMQK